jgi:hypothetical protein
MVRCDPALPKVEAEEIRMNRLVVRAYPAAALVAVTLTSCGGTTPASPSPVLTTDTFTGTLTPGQKVVHPYAVKAAGQVTTTRTTLSGASVVGVGVGTWDGTTCTVGAHAENVAGGGYFLTNVPIPQNLCALVYDVGGITATASYTVTVSHP